MNLVKRSFLCGKNSLTRCCPPSSFAINSPLKGGGSAGWGFWGEVVRVARRHQTVFLKQTPVKLLSFMWAQLTCGAVTVRPLLPVSVLPPVTEPFPSWPLFGEKASVGPSPRPARGPVLLSGTPYCQGTRPFLWRSCGSVLSMHCMIV